MLSDSFRGTHGAREILSPLSDTRRFLITVYTDRWSAHTHSHFSLFFLIIIALFRYFCSQFLSTTFQRLGVFLFFCSYASLTSYRQSTGINNILTKIHFFFTIKNMVHTRTSLRLGESIERPFSRDLTTTLFSPSQPPPPCGLRLVRLTLIELFPHSTLFIFSPPLPSPFHLLITTRANKKICITTTSSSSSSPPPSRVLSPFSCRQQDKKAK